MFRSLWQTVSAQVSGQAAAQAVADIARFHRIQASPGYHRAAELVVERLARAGLAARILAFPADCSASFWHAASFQEWDARSATLHLLEPSERLADFRALPLSLVARSLSFDGEAEVVVLGKGEDPAEYEGLDLCGKIVLARGQVQRVHDLAVVRRGAVGLIFDGMAWSEPVRPAWSLDDATQYTSFWWAGRQPSGFGFALSPRQGQRLRQLAREQTLRVRAHVDARLYNGALEVVEATIPGATDEEIVLVAHLCHPQPSANDNASGAAALLEVASSLATLLARGELTAPRRTLRFLWVPEMSGTFAYLSRNEERIPRMVAGVNLDMVGEDQEQCGSSLLLTHPPHAFPNFTTVLLGTLRENLLTDVKTHGGVGGYPLFRTADDPFNAGSDHYIFSDPSVGVPMPMIGQWPDRFYHTSADTPDRTSPRMLERVATLTAVYGYWLAQAGATEAHWLAGELSARFRSQVIVDLQRAVTCADDEGQPGRAAQQRSLEWAVARQRAALDSVRRLADVDVTVWQAGDGAFALAEWARVAERLPDRPLPEGSGERLDRVGRRRGRGPLQIADKIAGLDEAGRDRWWSLLQRLYKESYTLPVLAEFWLDGVRSLDEIAVRVQEETGVEAGALLAEYFAALVELGELVEQ